MTSTAITLRIHLRTMPDEQVAVSRELRSRVLAALDKAGIVAPVAPVTPATPPETIA
jgi:small-conductance mechanosensitive channel